MAARARGEAVYERLATDEARTALRWIVEGRLDADLMTLVLNAKKRQKLVTQVAFRIGEKVRVVTPGSKWDGMEGTVVKINPTRVVVATEYDRKLAEKIGGGDPQALVDLASLAVPPERLVVVG